MADQYVVIETEDAELYYDFENFLGHGSSDRFLRITADESASFRVWKTKMDSVIVSIDHEETELPNAEILDVKIYNGADND